MQIKYLYFSNKRVEPRVTRLTSSEFFDKKFLSSISWAYLVFQSSTKKFTRSAGKQTVQNFSKKDLSCRQSLKIDVGKLNVISSLLAITSSQLVCDKQDAKPTQSPGLSFDPSNQSIPTLNNNLALQERIITA